jgi:transcriptional regulator
VFDESEKIGSSGGELTLEGMYIPAAFVMEPGSVLGVLRQVGLGHLVTHDPDASDASGLVSTALPFVVDDEVSSIRAHFAKGNPHWRHVQGSQALLIVPALDAYISPRWYPSKTEHGKVVPTSNYELIHLHGQIEIHHEVEWKRQLVVDLTAQNENAVVDPERTDVWRISDAPASFVDSQLKAIVGVQLNISRVEAKQKLSQNKPKGDQVGAAEGLGRSDKPGDLQTSERMQTLDRPS